MQSDYDEFVFQFLCLKNICLFLGACQSTFNIPQRDLFEAWELYKVSDFGKVLTTLSKLSKSEAAQRAGIQSVFLPYRLIVVNLGHICFIKFVS
jgi:hypothetical protein